MDRYYHLQVFFLIFILTLLKYLIKDTNSSALYLFYCSLRWLATRCDVISNLLTFGICCAIVTNTATITPDMAGAMLALALQLSVLYQMSLRLTLEVNSRMSSAESLLAYTKSFPLEEQRQNAVSSVEVLALNSKTIRT